MDIAVSAKGNQIEVLIPTNLVDMREIQQFLDFLRYRSLVRKSKATAKDVEMLSTEINAALKQRNATRRGK